MAETPVLKLYNTLTREKTAFAPIDADNVRMYVCGPTVYDFAHIGNARPAIVFDVLYRLLKHKFPGAGKASDGSRVTYVRNITDVDDKINARALRDFPGMELNEAIRLVTEKTETQYQADVTALCCLPPTAQPRATEHIFGMVRIIQQLIDRGNAYVATGGEGREVLFSTGSMPDYGQLSKRKLDEQQAGARVAVEAHKRNPADFVLWKESAADQPGWYGEFTVDGTKTAIFGRPGWHIECSAMAGHFLGKEFDIHGGGLDLIFPHHENEIAQSRCAHGTDVMANVWMHNGFVQVEGRKMSKSDGNFVTIHELLETETFGGRKWPGEVLRLAMLMTHYRQPIDFSVKRLEEAESILQSWAEARKVASDHNWIAVANRQVTPYPSDEIVALIADDLSVFISDDMNTAAVITRLQQLAKEAVRGNVDAAFQLVNGAAFLGFTMDGFISQSFVDELADDLDIGEAIAARLELLKSKNFAEADKIRDDLLAKGIQLKDGKDPATGERVATWEVKR